MFAHALVPTQLKIKCISAFIVSCASNLAVLFTCKSIHQYWHAIFVRLYMSHYSMPRQHNCHSVYWCIPTQTSLAFNMIFKSHTHMYPTSPTPSHTWFRKLLYDIIVWHTYTIHTVNCCTLIPVHITCSVLTLLMFNIKYDATSVTARCTNMSHVFASQLSQTDTS